MKHTLLKATSILLISIFVIYSFIGDIAYFNLYKNEFSFKKPHRNILSSVYAMDFNTAVQEGRGFGFQMGSEYKLDNIDSTLRQKCIEKDAQGNCTRYLIDDQTGKSSLIPGIDQVKGNIGSYKDYIGTPPEELRVQGQSTGGYTYFLTGISRNKCVEYTPCKVSCSQFQGAFCQTPSNYIEGNPPFGSVFLGFGYENFRYSEIIENPQGIGEFKCFFDVYKWYSHTVNGVTTYYKQFDKTDYENRTCTSKDLKEDPVFSNKCFAYDSQGKCILWSSSKDILERSYTDCRRVMDPIYEAAGTEEKCSGRVTSQNQTEDKPLCNVTNQESVSQQIIFTECSPTPNEQDQIYSVCENYWLWYKVFDRDVTVASCPTTCQQVGGLCSPPSGCQGSPPQNSIYLGQYHHSFTQNIVFGGLLCQYQNVDYYSESGVCYTQGASPTSYTIQCPHSCEQVGGGLCSNYPANYQIVGSPPPGSTLVGESYEEFLGCSYKVYKWYRKLSHASIERVKLQRFSNCPSSELDKMIEECWVKFYEICQPGGGNCVVVIDNSGFVSQNKVCKSFPGVTFNYNLCPNDGGQSQTGGEIPEYTGMTLDDGSGHKPITKYSDIETIKGFGDTVMKIKTYGGDTVRPFLNDFSAKVIFSCDTYLPNPPECQHLIDQGCTLKSQRCIDPIQTDPAEEPDCIVYEYTYFCGPEEEKVIGYDLKYVCNNAVIEGIRCLGSDCADTTYEPNQDFIAFATGIEILKQIQIDTDKVDPNNIKIFPGEKRECQSWPKNCCKNLSGAMGVAEYARLGFTLARVYQMLNVGWTGAMATNATILGNYFGFLGFTTLEVVATSDMAIALTLPEAGGFQIVGIGKDLGEVYTVIMADSATVTVSTIMTAISIAMLAYSLLSIIYNLIFRCTREDVETGVQVGQKRCAHIGTRCAQRILGICIKRKKVHCCFNSLLARIIHEQGRHQLGKGWGNCEGFTPQELSMLDFASMDLSEYMNYIIGEFKERFNTDEIEALQLGAESNIPSRRDLIRDRLDQYYRP